MIVEYIRYDLTQHTPEDLIAAYAQASPYLTAAPECLGFDLAQCSDAPNSLILRIHWTSVEGHMQGFRKGPHFPGFLQAIRPFVAEIAEMRHYTETAITWQR